MTLPQITNERTFSVTTAHPSGSPVTFVAYMHDDSVTQGAIVRDQGLFVYELQYLADRLANEAPESFTPNASHPITVLSNPYTLWDWQYLTGFTPAMFRELLEITQLSREQFLQRMDSPLYLCSPDDLERAKVAVKERDERKASGRPSIAVAFVVSGEETEEMQAVMQETLDAGHLPWASDFQHQVALNMFAKGYKVPPCHQGANCHCGYAEPLAAIWQSAVVD